MPNCAVATCTNNNRKTKGKDIKYFGFPKNEELAKQWIVACRRKDPINLANATVCSIHFEDRFIEVPLKHRLLNYSPMNARLLKDDAVPTLNLPGVSQKENVERAQRIAKRNIQKEVQILLNTPSTSRIPEEVEDIGDDVECMNPADDLELVHVDDVYMEIPECDEQQTNMPMHNEPIPSSQINTENEVSRLMKRVEELELQNGELSNKVQVQEKLIGQYEEAMAKIFTKGQICKLLKTGPQTRVRWSAEDITAAISLRSVSPKAYRYLGANNYPLPAMSTLRKWVSNIDISPGILKTVINLIEKKATSFSESECLCVLTFDEMYISNKIEIDKKHEQVLGPHSTCQTVVVRGLVSKWKQPIYYDFDQPMTRQILEQIIAILYKAKLIVVAIASDMGTGNISLWSELGVGYDKSCHFQHPSDDSLKIFVYADVPHLMKLARNHLIDHGFCVGNVVINRDYLEALLNISTSELTFAHKLTPQHLQVQGSMRQRVKLAVQVLSNSVSKAIEYCGPKGLMPEHWKKAAEIIQIFNAWFDMLNSRCKFVGNCPGRNAYGTDLTNQRDLLHRMTELISSIRVGKHKAPIPFQKGILLTNESLESMYNYLKENYGVEYILTSRLNQDVLENLFSYLRGMGGANDHPSPLDLKYRFRWYILGKHSAAIFTENRNTEESDETCLLSIIDDENQKEICLSQNILAKLVEDPVEEVVIAHEEENAAIISFVDPPDICEEELDEEFSTLLRDFESREKVNMESLKYVAGFVAHKFRKKYNLGIPTRNLEKNGEPDWLQTISHGSLLHPNDELWEITQKLDAEFHKMHGNSLSKEKLIFHQLANKTMAEIGETSIPFEVILCLSRTRTYIRLRDLNRRISFKNCQRKLEKKMSKFTNKKK